MTSQTVTLLSDVRMYADDTNLTFASKDPEEPEELFSSLTHDLSNLKQWLDSNRLSLNVLKTKCLIIIIGLFNIISSSNTSIEKQLTYKQGLNK